MTQQDDEHGKVCAYTIVMNCTKCQPNLHDRLCPDYIPMSYAFMTEIEIEQDYLLRKRERESLDQFNIFRRHL